MCANSSGKYSVLYTDDISTEKVIVIRRLGRADGIFHSVYVQLPDGVLKKVDSTF